MARAKLRRSIEAGKRARVLVVDDSLVVRRILALALEADPCLEVVGAAQNGREALEQIAKLKPDAVTMDIEMPEMDGLEALRHIRKLNPQPRVVMVSTLTERGAAATFEALALGADDYVTKLSAGKSVEDSTAKLRAELSPKIKQFFSFSEDGARNDDEVTPMPILANRPLEKKTLAGPPPFANTPRVVAIGVSTGGPNALARILPDLPRDFPLPILIVQHMPPLFTRLLCERLQQISALAVSEACQGERLQPGHIYVAPGDFHMRVHVAGGETQPSIFLDQSSPENSCRPAVDVLFESVAAVFGGAAVAAILTGMGQDGLRGSRLLKVAGATIFAQDEETSAVWGMPRAVAEAGLAHEVLPLTEIIPHILQFCLRSGKRDRIQFQGAR